MTKARLQYTTENVFMDVKIEDTRSVDTSGFGARVVLSATVTHMPTGVSATASGERSAFQNRAQAMDALVVLLNSPAPAAPVTEVIGACPAQDWATTEMCDAARALIIPPKMVCVSNTEVRLEYTRPCLNDIYVAMRAAAPHSDVFVPAPFICGNEYATIGGGTVKIVQRNHAHSGYETVLGDDGVHRYNRPQDMGRVTGSGGDGTTHPGNLIPLYIRVEKTEPVQSIADLNEGT